MTLTTSLAVPIDPRLWPDHTTTSPDDVTVAGVSLDCLVDWCGTPCVHTTDRASVILTRVETIETLPDGTREAWMDAELEHCDATWQQARLIGRISTAHSSPVRLRPTNDPDRIVELPADLRPGDLIAIPSPAIIPLRELHRGAVHPERYAD